MSAKILDLIWTNIGANMVVGTKGLQDSGDMKCKRNGQTTSTTKPSVTLYLRHVKYRYAFRILAFLALMLAIVAFASTLFFRLVAGEKPSTIHNFLNRTCTARYLIDQSYKSQGDMASHRAIMGVCSLLRMHLQMFPQPCGSKVPRSSDLHWVRTVA